MGYKNHEGSLYNYTAGVYCGVLVTEPVMRKLAKLQAKHLEDVKRLLTDENDRGNVFPASWTLHYPNGVQTHVDFYDPSESVERRIKSATHAHPPKHVPLCFIASGMDEAKDMADTRFAQIEEVAD